MNSQLKKYCKICNLKFSNSSNYKRHLESSKHLSQAKANKIKRASNNNHNTNYACNNCGYETKYKGNYSRHINKNCRILKEKLKGESKAEENVNKLLKIIEKQHKEMSEIKDELIDLKSGGINIGTQNNTSINNTSIINNNQNNFNIISLDYLNKEYADMPSLDSLINHLKTDFQLTQEEADSLVLCSKAGMDSFVSCLWIVMQRRTRSLIFRNGIKCKGLKFPMVTMDGNNRTHLEKTDDKWVRKQGDVKILQIMDTCSDQIFQKTQERPDLSKGLREKVICKFKKKTYQIEDQQKTQEQLFQDVLKEVKIVANEIIQKQEAIKIEYQRCIDNGIFLGTFGQSLSSTAIKKLPIETKYKYHY